MPYNQVYLLNFNYDAMLELPTGFSSHPSD